MLKFFLAEGEGRGGGKGGGLVKMTFKLVHQLCSLPKGHV